MNEDIAGSGGGRAAALAALAIAAVGLAVFLFPVDSDGAFASFDGVIYGIEAEQGTLPPENAFHPLFHVVKFPITRALARAGVASPGHVAVRLLAGIGAAWALWLVALAAGRAAWVAGAAFAAVLLATRGFLVNAAAGETVVPACAAALWVLHEVFRAPARPWRVAVALTVALLVRADNVLIVPGALAALWLTWDPAVRGRRIVVALAFAAVATIAGYVAFWWVATRGAVPIWTYMFPERVHDWTAQNVASRPLTHVDASSAAVVGRTWPLKDPNLWIGPGFVALQLVAAFLLRGSSRARPLAAGLALTLAVRGAFFSWYDVVNSKWAVMTLGLVAWTAASLCRGEPRRPRPARAAGLVLLAALAFAVPLVHGAFTLRLRDRGFIGAMRHAVEEGRGARVLAMGPNVNLALDFLGVHHAILDLRPDPSDSLAALVREAQSRPEPALMIYERWTPWVVSGDPWMMLNAPRRRLPIDDASPSPSLRIITWDGYAYAARYEPAAPASRR